MTIANAVVAGILRSPAHSLLSNNIQVVRYRGQRSGAMWTMPTQYVELDEVAHVPTGDVPAFDVPNNRAIVILVGNASEKHWWRNFRQPWPIELLVRGTWQTMTAQAHVRSSEPAIVDGALEHFWRKFPRQRSRTNDAEAVVVICRPIASPVNKATRADA